jgi:hypothetical protein
MQLRLRRLAVLSLLSTACGGGGDGGGDADSGSHIDGLLHIVKGPSAGSAFRLAAAGPGSDGLWYVSPDRVEVTLTRINFPFADGRGQSNSELTGCTATFDKADPSHSSILDCPITVETGTYAGISAHFAGTFRVLIDDAVNGIYTDPTSATLLSSTEPAGGAQFIDYTRPLGDSAFEQPFVTPLVVDNLTTTLSLSLVMDGVQTLRVGVSDSGGTLAFRHPDAIPVNIFPTVGDVGVTRYFTTAGTAESYNDEVVLANILRVYYSPDGQPAYAFTEQTSGELNGCALPAVAFPGDPATSDFGAGPHGGWLGKDSSGTTCWASSRDSWATYEAYFTINDVASIGSSATLSCQHTTSPTPPSSGSTYASGCPAIAADVTVPMTLVAQ